MSRVPFVTHEGHWHPEGVYLIMKRRGVRAWRIEFEQKRPDVASEGYMIMGAGPLKMWNSEHHIWVGSREASCYFRDGEDGTELTEFEIPLPWPGFGREWRIYTDQEKWSVTVVALAEYDPIKTLYRAFVVAYRDFVNWRKRRAVRSS